MPDPSPSFLDRPDGSRLAYLKQDGSGPYGLVFLPGFKSDMGGTKADWLADWAEGQGLALTRFDYFGHGASTGPFTDGSIGRWKEDALAIIDEITDGPQILIGSSMGGWIGLLATLARPDRVKGFIGIAAAPDFTEKLMWADFSDDIKDEIMTEGLFQQPSDYDDEPYIITKKLIEDGRSHLLMDGPIDLPCPAHFLQGMDDPDVPYTHALALMDCLKHNPNVDLTLIAGGDHRLSEPHDLARLGQTIANLIDGLS